MSVPSFQSRLSNARQRFARSHQVQVPRLPATNVFQNHSLSSNYSLACSRMADD